MVDVSMRWDVAVIDEIQMMADPNRGWAWTRALQGCMSFCLTMRTACLC